MPVVEAKKETKVKLVSLKTGVDGIQRQSTRTFSNITNGVNNEQLMTGVKAVIGLQTAAPTAIVRVDETTLADQV